MEIDLSTMGSGAGGGGGGGFYGGQPGYGGQPWAVPPDPPRTTPLKEQLAVLQAQMTTLHAQIRQSEQVSVFFFLLIFFTSILPFYPEIYFVCGKACKIRKKIFLDLVARPLYQ
jgi:hypothetical protein